MRLTLWILVALTLAQTAAAADFEALHQAVERGEYASAVPELEAGAERGDARFLTLLAALYQRGEGVSKDTGRAIELYRRAADLGNAEAQFNLGNIYLLGEGVRADEAWALTYYRQAATQGHAHAARNLAELYRAAGLDPPPLPADGTPAPEDRARTAAEPAVATSEPVPDEPLAPTKRIGDPLPAAKAEDPVAATPVAPAVAAPEPSPSVSPPASSTAIVQAEDPPPQPEVSADEADAIRLAREHGVEVDVPDEAVTPAAPDPNRAALQAAVAAVADGDGERGVGDLLALADGGYGPAQYEISRNYLSGNGVPQDTGAAMSWLHRAAESGHPQARHDLANRYLIGAGVEVDDAMAVTLFRDAARDGHGPSRERLAGIYADAGLPMPTLERPRAQMAPSVAAPPVPVTSVAASTMPDATASAESAATTAPARAAAPTPSPAARAAAIVAKESSGAMPAPPAAPVTPDVPVVSPAPAAPPREPYEYAVVDHDAHSVPQVAADEIDPPRPAAHRVISGGELAQERDVPPPVADTAVEDDATAVVPVETAVAATAPAELTRSASDTLPGAATTAAVVASEVREEAVAETAPAVAAAVTGAGVTAAGAIPTEPPERRGFLQKLKDALVAGEPGGAAVVSRAPGSAPPAAAQDGDLKLVMAEQAEPNPVPEIPTLNEAKQALAAGDYERAARQFLSLAERGDAEAQAHIGYMTYQGEGVPRDRERAVDWYRRSAVQGHRDAQYNLAVAYAFGEGAPQDDAEAVVWYRRAAQQGSAISQYSLGVSYALGEGVAQSDEQAATWYRAAAQQGYPAAQYNLAYMYRAGKGLAQDDSQALKWFTEAARNGHASAQYSLGYMYRSGKGVERNMEEAIRWYRLAAAQGHPEARADLTSMAPDG